jgi:sugar (pentulose or hexulose) kinase
VARDAANKFLRIGMRASASAILWRGSYGPFLAPSESTKISRRTTRPPPACVLARTISWRLIGGTATAFPHGDSSLSGLLLGMNLRTSGPDIYRALLESLCFGARSIIDHLAAGGAPIERVILTSGLAQNNALLLQLMADILGRDIQVPQMPHVTAVCAAIHGAVAAGVVADYAEGSRQWRAKDRLHYRPLSESALAYRALYEQYCELRQNAVVRTSMHELNDLAQLRDD